MSEVTLRELRNNSAEVLERVARGEALTVTRDGEAIAELRPLRRRPVPAAMLLARWRRLPRLPHTDFAPTCEVLDGPNPYVSGREDEFAPHGFLTYELSGPAIRAEFRLANGELLSTKHV